MKYIVWFSWWIDSTYVARKLKEQWHDIFLVYIHNYWILNQENLIYLNKIADSLWVKLEIIDICKEFKKIIIDDFVNYYKSWKTPNPCIFCNPLIKFKVLDKIRLEKNADKTTTGHYAKTIKIKDKNYIATADDLSKEQSYMIYKLWNEDFLSNIEFHLWNKKKDDIKKIFSNINIPIKTKESQDICFIEDGNYINFIQKNYALKTKPWNIIDISWNIIWKHKWIIYYTIGQRKWLWINQKLYVLDIDYAKNNIIVWNENNLYKNTIEIKDFFIKEELLNNKNFIWEEVFAKIRYKASPEKIKSIENLWKKIIITFVQNVKSPTKWQHCVFYKNIDNQNIIIWWGEICG